MLKIVNMPESKQHQKNLCIEIYKKTIKKDVLDYIESQEKKYNSYRIL
jgi:hypothetical protein